MNAPTNPSARGDLDSLLQTPHQDRAEENTGYPGAPLAVWRCATYPIPVMVAFISI